MIVLEDIRKTYRVARRDEGLDRAARALFHREMTLVRALDGVSFRVGDGEMVGYIGPNGAGKSSTIKVMSGILAPDSGTCVIDGRVPWKERRAHVAHLGVVFGQRSQLWWDVPVGDSFALLRDIYRVDARTYRRNVEELSAALDLTQLLRTPARQLSLGQRMRCEIAASLLHDPDLLFLDEPTIGLDATSKRAVRAFVRRRNQERGTTVLLTTHDMQDVAALAGRILLIGRGRILLDGTLDSLRARFAGDKRVRVTTAAGATAPDADLPDGMRLEERLADGALYRVDASRLTVPDALTFLGSRAELSDVSVTGPTAEDMVLALYQEFSL